MPTFTGGNGAFTPSTTNDNYTLDYSATAGAFGKVIAIGWGGRLTTSTGYRTRWTRPTVNPTGSGTALVLGVHQPNYATAQGFLYSTYATSQPGLIADPGANLWAQDWNAQGGLGMIVMPLANPWWLSSGILFSRISCRNVAGTDASGSSYSCSFEE